MHTKDYEVWHNIKRNLHNKKARPFFHEGEVWFCSLGENIGFEEDGRGQNYLRPVIIVRKFNKEVCWGVPLTKSKRSSQYYYSFNLNSKTSTAILSQLRLIDCKRLQYKTGAITTKDLSNIRKNLRQLLS